MQERPVVVAAPGDDDGHAHAAGRRNLGPAPARAAASSVPADGNGLFAAAYGSGGEMLTIAGVSSSKHSMVSSEHNIMATMPRFAATPRRTSTAAMADRTEATTATTAATGHGDSRINESARIVRTNGTLVLATSTADLLAAYQTLRGCPSPPARIRAVHLGGVAATLYLCAVPPEVVLAALAATSVLNPQSLLTYLDLVLPPHAHTLTTGHLCLVATQLYTGAEVTRRRWLTRDALLLALVAAADVGRSEGWLDWLWPAPPPLNPAWPVRTAWTPKRHLDPGGRLYHPIVVLNAARALEPGAFDAEALTQREARELLASVPGRGGG